MQSQSLCLNNRHRRALNHKMGLGTQKSPGRAPGPPVSACDLTVWSLQHDLYPPGLESGKILLLKVPYGFLLKFILCS